MTKKLKKLLIYRKNCILLLEETGKKLLLELYKKSDRPILIGTWTDATWAIRFYEKRGFKRVSEPEKKRLLEKYWSIPQRQVATSVVLADRKWFDLANKDKSHLK